MAGNRQMMGPKGPGGRRPMVGPKVENPGKLFKRLMQYVMKLYGVHFLIVFVCNLV